MFSLLERRNGPVGLENRVAVGIEGELTAATTGHRGRPTAAARDDDGLSHCRRDEAKAAENHVPAADGLGPSASPNAPDNGRDQ